MKLEPQDVETLHEIVAQDDKWGSLMMPFLTNRQSVQRLIDKGLVVWLDAGLFLVARPTQTGRVIVKGAQ